MTTVVPPAATAAPSPLTAPAAADAPSSAPPAGEDASLALGAAVEDARKAVEQLRVVQFNVENLFDSKDDPDRNDPVIDPKDYEVKLSKLAAALRDAGDGAHVIALEEIENENVLRDLVARPELKELGYGYRMVEGNDVRGIDVGVLYRTEYVNVDRVEQSDAKAPDDAWWARPGGKLYSRPPLVVDMSMRGPGQAAEGHRELTVIVNHFKSKIGGSKWDELRTAQADHVAALVDARAKAEPGRGVLVMGDLNALPGEKPVEHLLKYRNGRVRMEAVTDRLPKEDRYTYIYRGQKNLLDHVMANKPLADALTGARIAHINSAASKKDIANPKTGKGSSDHDLIIAEFDLSKYTFGGAAPKE